MQEKWGKNMSKIKVIRIVIFIACFLGFIILIIGGFPYWSMATQALIQKDNFQVQSKERITASGSSTNTDSQDIASTAAKQDKNKSSSEDRSSVEAVQTQSEGSQTQAEEKDSQLGDTQTQSKATQSQAEGTPIQAEGQSQPENSSTSTGSSLSSGSVSPAETTKSQPSTTADNPGPTKEDLPPTPPPGAPGIPIHPYYDAAGNPPTAPGLAMRPRQFQSEKGKMAFLTFDDGPYPSTTPQILAILAKEHVQATFFDIGRQVELNPDLLKDEYEQGHVIGNHTYSHNMTELYKGPQAFLADVKKAEDIMYNIIGMRPQIIRAPGGTVGHFNISYFNAVDAAGYLMEDWNVDTGDTDARLEPEKLLINNVKEQIQGKSRVVILMHDLAGKTTTIQALPTIIEMLKKQGFSFGVLGPHVRPIVFPEGMHD